MSIDNALKMRRRIQSKWLNMICDGARIEDAPNFENDEVVMQRQDGYMKCDID